MKGFSYLAISEMLHDEGTYMSVGLSSLLDYQVLLGIYLTSQGGGGTTMHIVRARKFTNRYIVSIMPTAYHLVLEFLHEQGFIWIDNTINITLQDMGSIAIKRIEAKIRNRLRDYIYPVERAIKDGIVMTNGDIKFPEPFDWRNKYNPFQGVRFVAKNEWRASIKSGKKWETELSVGMYRTAIEAAKARDKYIRDNHLKTELSINLYP